MSSEFNTFLKKIGRPILGNQREPTSDQQERLANIERSLGIERIKEETVESEEDENA